MFLLADETGVISHSNVVMATLEPYEYVEDSTKVISLNPGEIRTMHLEVRISVIHHADDGIFLPIPSLLCDIRMATALEHLDACVGSSTTPSIKLSGAAGTVRSRSI